MRPIKLNNIKTSITKDLLNDIYKSFIVAEKLSEIEMEENIELVVKRNEDLPFINDLIHVSCNTYGVVSVRQVFDALNINYSKILMNCKNVISEKSLNIIFDLCKLSDTFYIKGEKFEFTCVDYSISIENNIILDDHDNYGKITAYGIIRAILDEIDRKE